MLACAPGELHDLALIAFGLVLAGRGWAITYLGPDTPVGKYLEKRGPGLHHVAYAVGDIDDVLGKLKEAGVE